MASLLALSRDQRKYNPHYESTRAQWLINCQSKWANKHSPKPEVSRLLVLLLKSEEGKGGLLWRSEMWVQTATRAVMVNSIFCVSFLFLLRALFLPFLLRLSSS